MKVIKMAKWYFPPTTNKNGNAIDDYDSKTIMLIESTLFSHPLIAMSDIHSQTTELLTILDEYVNMEKFIVLTAGDMAGKHVRGTDGNPTSDYEFIAKKAREFYFVQGNHDLPDKNNKQNTIKNKQNKFAMIQNGETVNSILGTIGGVNGIISNKIHPYKISQDKYETFLKKILQKRPFILITHDTPSIEQIYPDGQRYVGNVEIYNIINKHKPIVHFYGHCHHPTFYNFINGVNYINIDARVLIFVNPNYDQNQLFKKPLDDVYSKSTENLYEGDQYHIDK